MSRAAPGTASGGPVRPKDGTSPLVRDQLNGALAECSDDLLASADLDGRVLTWPRTGERLYGYSAEEMIGRPVEAFLGGGPAAQAVRRAAAGEEVGRTARGTGAGTARHSTPSSRCGRCGRRGPTSRPSP
jgi:PAS domain-containing protein